METRASTPNTPNTPNVVGRSCFGVGRFLESGFYAWSQRNVEARGFSLLTLLAHYAMIFCCPYETWVLEDGSIDAERSGFRLRAHHVAFTALFVVAFVQWGIPLVSLMRFTVWCVVLCCVFSVGVMGLRGGLGARASKIRHSTRTEEKEQVVLLETPLQTRWNQFMDGIPQQSKVLVEAEYQSGNRSGKMVVVLKEGEEVYSKAEHMSAECVGRGQGARSEDNLFPGFKMLSQGPVRVD